MATRAHSLLLQQTVRSRRTGNRGKQTGKSSALAQLSSGACPYATAIGMLCG